VSDLNFVFSYLDDILVESSSPVEHENHLRIVLDRLQKFHLTLNLNKCKFGVTELTFLGHTINSEGIKPTREKLLTSRNLKRSTIYDDS